MAKEIVTTKLGEKKSVLKGLRTTEKAVIQSDARGVYCFNVLPNSTKSQIVSCVKTQYKVTPLKVRLLAVPKGGKKAYVYLKKGDKITE